MEGEIKVFPQGKLLCFLKVSLVDTLFVLIHLISSGYLFVFEMALAENESGMLSAITTGSLSSSKLLLLSSVGTNAAS